jgi:serine/threonine protein kinase
MTPERWDRVKKVFSDALEQRPADREIFLTTVCGDDESLRAEVASLLARQSGEPLSKNPLPLCDFPPEEEETREQVEHEPRPEGRRHPLAASEGMEGRRIGPYEIAQQIGQGGMGSVYLAFRADHAFEKQVAIKFVRPNAQRPDLMGRFHRECRILASLDHPNIARLYDAGTTDEGLPYFVMEYVDGEPIDAWCDRQSLTVDQRLRLFKTVCDAVHYAHQHQVIHRDLKPSNILVMSDGTAKLLDFGIAKTLNADDEQSAGNLTRTGEALMTPEYASPEQIRGELVTPASDIYSLGVVLYGLLTGRRPYKLKSWVFHEIVRVICQESPRKPSQAVKQDDDEPVAQGDFGASAAACSRVRGGSPAALCRRLQGDVDKIVLKALSKDAFERYRSAQQFGMDIAFHLDGQPVLARAESVLRRLSRLALRRRMEMLVGLVTLVGVATGAIEVQLLFGIYLLIGLALLGMWYGATSPRLGRWLDDHVWPNAWTGFLAFFIIKLIRRALPRGALPDGQAKDTLGLALVVFLILVPLVISAYISGWLMRERNGGRLLLAIKAETPSGTVPGLLLGEFYGLMMVGALRAWR